MAGLKTILLGIRIQKRLHRRLVEQSYYEDKNISELIRHILELYLKEQDKKMSM